MGSDRRPFSRTLDDIAFVGSTLERPECVLATQAGDLFTCDWRGAIARIAPDGKETVIGSPDLKARNIRSNGIALRADGSFLFANVGSEGGVWQLAPDGQASPFLQEVDGLTLPSTNFVWVDDSQRVWVCVSTRDHASHDPAHRFSRTQADEFIALVDEKGARVVGDSLVWTNECRIDPEGRFLVVNETMARRLTRFRLGADGSLSARETVVEFGSGTWPDGLAFDQEGAIWVVSIISNRVIRIDRDGRQEMILEDCDSHDLATAEQAYAQGGLTRQIIFSMKGKKLANLASIAFGGPELKSVYLGTLGNRGVATFTSPVAGVAPSHWRVHVE